MKAIVDFFANNLGTALVALLLALALLLVVLKMVRDKKKGVSSCGCGCAGCPMSGKCHSRTDENK